MKVLHQIAGKATASISGRTYPDRDPWTCDVIALVAAGDAEDTRAAIEAAHDAFPGWAAQLPGERQLVFLRAAEAPHRRTREIKGLLAAETGCGDHWAQVQVDVSVSPRQAAGRPA